MDGIYPQDFFKCVEKKEGELGAGGKLFGLRQGVLSGGGLISDVQGIVNFEDSFFNLPQ